MNDRWLASCEGLLTGEQNKFILNISLEITVITLTYACGCTGDLVVMTERQAAGINKGEVQ